MASLLLKRLLITALFGLATSAGACGGYFYAQHEDNKQELQLYYEGSAVRAKLDASMLTDLRSGDSTKALKLLSSLLEGELISLNDYEQNLTPSERSPKVYEYVASVREYYERFPEAERPTYGKEGLALKRQ